MSLFNFSHLRDYLFVKNSLTENDPRGLVLHECTKVDFSDHLKADGRKKCWTIFLIHLLLITVYTELAQRYWRGERIGVEMMWNIKWDAGTEVYFVWAED